VNKIPFYTFHFPGFVGSHQRKGGQRKQGRTMGTFTRIVQ